jgi:hypothetical protein
MRVYSFVAALIGWASLLVRYIGDGNFQSVAQTVAYISYFSILTNILAALTLTLVALAPAGRRQWLTRPPAVTAIALYMCVTGLPFAFQSLAGLQGWQLAAEIGLHHVMPVAFFLFWLIIVPKGTLMLRHAFVWLIFPLAYVAYLLVCGPCYPFLDVGLVGADRVLGNIVLTGVGFLTFGQSLVLIDRVMGRARRYSGDGEEAVASTHQEAEARTTAAA